MKALVVVENKDAASQLVAGAYLVANEVVVVSLGTKEIAGIADKAIHIDIPEENIVEDAYATLFDISDTENISLVLAEPTRGIKALVGRLAAHKKTAAITDVISLDDLVATTMYFGGVAQRKNKSLGDIAIFTVGGGVFSDAETNGNPSVEEVAFKTPENPVKKIGTQMLTQSGGNLPKAEIIVAAGRGFSEKEELGLAHDLCSAFGAELACSRPLTEGLDWMPKGTYIGVSGLMLSPKVYVGVGISGQMQHMVGCDRAATIVAINKDANAPIFKQCDFGIVGDLKTVLPAISAAF